MNSGKYEVKIIKAHDNVIAKAECPTALQVEQAYAAGEWISKEYDPRGLEELVSNSSILPQCIRAYRSNIAGFGIAVRYTEDTKETEEKAAEYTRAEDIIRRLCSDKETSEVFADIVEARETYGIAYAEIIRTLDGEVCQMEFVEETSTIEKTAPLEPYVEVTYFDKGEEVKRRRKFRKYKQQIGGTTVYFREFGDPRRMDRRSGRYMEANEELEIENEANEILDFPLGTSPYGKVRWLGQVLGVDGSRRAEILNNNYFKNGRHTPLMIVVRGGTLTDDSFDKLTQYMDDIKGEAGQHAFIVLEAENADSRADFDAAVKPEIDIKDMAGILQKDELFQGYLDNNRRRVQSAFLLPDIYVGYSTDYNRATAQTAQEVTEQQVFQPERNSLAWIVNHKLLNGYNFKHVEAYFRSPDLNNPESLASLLNICNSAGGLTPNKAKSILYDALGETSENYDGDWADRPIALYGADQQTAEGSEQLDKKLETQIEKAAAEHEDEIVAVMKEIRSLLKYPKKGLTNTPKGDIIEKGWVTIRGHRVFIDDAEGKLTNFYNAIEAGTIKTKICSKQDKHRKGSKDYNAAIARGEHPSYIDASKMDIQHIINEHVENIQPNELYIEPDGQYKLVFTHKTDFAFNVDQHTGEETPTNRGTIHFSKEGSHLVPTKRKE